MNEKSRIDSKLKKRLVSLAEKYEVPEFICKDPSQFMHNYSAGPDQEIAAFITAQLSFGRRELFIAKLKDMFEAAGKSPFQWIKSENYKNFFSEGEKKFYRFYSHNDMKKLCETLRNILSEYGTLGKAVKARYEALKETELKVQKELLPVMALIGLFPDCACVSQNPKGACKRLHMFLRWMVRPDSPVDLGLWTWCKPEDLLIPLDVHVMKESISLGLIPEKSGATAKTCINLTRAMKEIFPGDPCRADFALFGLGVDSEK